MIESELLERKENADEEAIINNIKKIKKLLPLLRSKQRKSKDIQEKKENSTDDFERIPLFGNRF